MATNRSNTVDNRGKKGGNGKPFVKGDIRINRLGRPRSFDALRKLAQQIADETATTTGGEPLIVSGHVATVAEMILRTWAKSDNSQLARGFIEIAYGKVPDELKIDLSRLNDAELIKFVGPILERLGIGLEPPNQQGLHAEEGGQGATVADNLPQP